MVASGPDSASPHHEASERVIAAGEPIVLDIGGTIEGYGSDTTRTLWVTGGDPAKRPDQPFRHLFGVLAAAQDASRRSVRPGIAAEAVDAAARGPIEAEGYGEAFFTGPATDRPRGPRGTVHRGRQQEPLRPGMAFSIEPGIISAGPTAHGSRTSSCAVRMARSSSTSPRELYVVDGSAGGRCGEASLRTPRWPHERHPAVSSDDGRARCGPGEDDRDLMTTIEPRPHAASSTRTGTARTSPSPDEPTAPRPSASRRGRSRRWITSRNVRQSAIAGRGGSDGGPRLRRPHRPRTSTAADRARPTVPGRRRRSRPPSRHVVRPTAASRSLRSHPSRRSLRSHPSRRSRHEGTAPTTRRPTPTAHRRTADHPTALGARSRPQRPVHRAAVAPVRQEPPFVPMHELRRRFAIDGDDDDVTPVRLDPGWVYVGLPNREGLLLGDLLRAGEIGYELSLDPRRRRHRRLPDAPYSERLTVRRRQPHPDACVVAPVKKKKNFRPRSSGGFCLRSSVPSGARDQPFGAFAADRARSVFASKGVAFG